MVEEGQESSSYKEIVKGQYTATAGVEADAPMRKKKKKNLFALRQVSAFILQKIEKDRGRSPSRRGKGRTRPSSNRVPLISPTDANVRPPRMPGKPMIAWPS